MCVCARARARARVCVCVLQKTSPSTLVAQLSRGEQPVELAVGETCKEFLPFVATDTCFTRVHRACKDLVHVHCK